MHSFLTSDQDMRGFYLNIEIHVVRISLTRHIRRNLPKIKNIPIAPNLRMSKTFYGEVCLLL